MTAISRATDNLRRVLVDAVELAAGGAAGERELAAALAYARAGRTPARAGRLRRLWLHARLGWHLDPTAVAVLDRAARHAGRQGDRHVGREHLAAALA